MFRTRLITALVLLPVAIGAVFAGGWWFFIGVSLAALVAGWEFQRMMRAGSYNPSLAISLGLIIGLIVDSFWVLELTGLIIGLAVILALVRQLFQTDSRTPTADWAMGLAGGLYVGWGLSRLVALRQMEDGLAWVWLALLCTWGADVFAYLVGSTWGRHKIWPRLSPKKSWEGLLGSVAGGLLGAVIVALAFGLSWGQVLLAGPLLPIVAFFGDLAESMMKRDVGVKDSSHLLPGHGGLLDRIDSLLFVSVVVYYYVIWIGKVI